MTTTQRAYPMACRSLYCGETDRNGETCRNCENRPALDEFEAWRAAHAAVPVDPVWSPCLYASTLPTGSAGF